MKKIATNMASLFLSVVANRIFPILLLPFLSRALGHEQFGRYMMAAAFAYLLAQTVEWGFNMSAVRQIALVAKDRRQIGGILSNVALGRLMIIALLLPLCAACRPWLSFIAPDSGLYWAAVAYGLTYAFDFRFAFYGLQESRSYLVLTFSQYLASFILITVAVRQPEDAWLAFFLPTLCILLTTGISMLMLRRWAELSRPSFSGAIESLKGSFQVFLARNIFQSSSQLGVLILGLFATPQLAGWLAVVERVCRTLGQLLLYPVQVGLTPVILQDAGNNRRRATLFHLGSLAAALGLAALATATLYMFAPFILHVLLGSAPEPAVAVLRLLSIYPVVFILINQGGIFWLYLLHWDRENLAILLGYTALFALLLFALASQWQLNGVAFGILAAGILLACTYAAFFSIRGIAPWTRPLGKALEQRRHAAATVPGSGST